MYKQSTSAAAGSEVQSSKAKAVVTKCPQSSEIKNQSSGNQESNEDRAAGDGNGADQEEKKKFIVPEGRRKERMEQYCQRFCKVGLVIEAKSEKDSWNSVSKAGNANKVSKVD